MLDKLIKHEFTALGRTLIVIHMVLVVVSLLTAGIGLLKPAGNFFSLLIVPAVTILYFVVVFGVGFITLFVVAQRFYTNLLGPEGYLMFTLPVSRRDLILAKFIPAMSWHMISTVLSIASVVIVALAWTDTSILAYQLLSGINELFSLGEVSTVLIVALIALTFAGSANYILMAYLSMALGQLANKGRIVLSVAIYFGIYMTLQFLGLIVVAIVALVAPASALEVQVVGGHAFTVIALAEPFDDQGLLALVLLGATALTLGASVAYFFITERLLDRRLNLL
ncbi:MAG: hypothetical protein FWE48_01990 [Coriobacteriia bacterium]|nr:hypothetical protein [Coriobacteriia bacterium]MCL2870815.1 hypothetical protein [Coriobacteriia bacterium]